MHRRRTSRRRLHIPVGDTFLPRLGPAGDEPFAGIDDVLGEPLPRPHPATSLEQLRFVALDCETTGQSPHGLVELGAVAFTLERHIMSFETLVHNTDHINPYARRIHGIGAETLGGAPPAELVLARFVHFASGSVLIEHSADAFDTRLIARTLGSELEADNVDTSRLAAKIWDLHDTIGLERMCQELGVHHRGPHHALADAEATAACFIELVSRGREMHGWSTLADLLEAGSPPAKPLFTDESERRRRRRGGRRHRRAPAGDSGQTEQNFPAMNSSE